MDFWTNLGQDVLDLYNSITQNSQPSGSTDAMREYWLNVYNPYGSNWDYVNNQPLGGQGGGQSGNNPIDNFGSQLSDLWGNLTGITSATNTASQIAGLAAAAVAVYLGYKVITSPAVGRGISKALA